MSERERSTSDDRWMSEIMRRRLTRRSVLKGVGIGVAGFSLASFLAACGGGDGGGAGGNGGGGFDIAEIYGGEAGDSVRFANWPFYLDQAKDDN
ncbi:MAG: hypothetical protein ACXWFU_14870, partial [Actinomycetota bacterium]